MRMGFCFGVGALIAISSQLCMGDEPRAADRPVLRFAYFVPTDREPLPDAAERLDRVMTEVQTFYRKGMKENGYGPLTFELDRDVRSGLRLHVVRAKGPMSDYGRDDSDKVRNEVKKALKHDGLDMDRETVVIFQMLLAWHEDKANELGPYVGGGDLNSGTAWVYDDAKLDVRLLSSKQAGGYYGGPCSLGEFNSHYIGGIAHELGHALSLPHDKERGVERVKKGNSLMGGGNHTYGQELRHEGTGSFLSPASAMLLSHHPLFTGQRVQEKPPLSCRLLTLEPSFASGVLTLTGRLEAAPGVFGLIAYNDEERIESDYDAVGYTCPIGRDGRFSLKVDEFKPGRYQMRWKVCYQDGRTSAFTFRYVVDAHGQPELTTFKPPAGGTHPADEG